jgi:hypothetical protein
MCIDGTPVPGTVLLLIRAEYDKYLYYKTTGSYKLPVVLALAFLFQRMNQNRHSSVVDTH